MQFIARPAAACGGTLLATLPHGGPYQRSRPILPGPPRDAATLRHLLRRQFEQVHPPEPACYRFADAIVRGPGIVTLPGNIVVAESLLNTDGAFPIGDLHRTGPASFTAADPFPAPTRLPATPHVLLKQHLDPNYGHWLIESLPRIALVRHLPEFATARFITANAYGMGPAAQAMPAVQAASLAPFGIGADRISPSFWGPLAVPDLIYPLPLTEHPWVKAPLAIALLEELAGLLPPPDHPAGERVFLLRPPTGRRALLNQAAIATHLAGHGYTAVTPSALDFPAQVATLSGARCVIGTLGAECSNLAFAPRSVRFLGLAPAFMADDFFWDLVSLKAGTYACLHAEDGSGPSDDFTIALPALDAARALIED